MICAVISNEPLADRFFHLTLQPERPIGAITPGQFVMVQCSGGGDPLLRRPMSVADYEPDGARFGLVIQVVGKGTRLLSELEPGDMVDTLGPFGRGFAMPDNVGPVWLVAGGTGVAPFMGLVKANAATREITVLQGARSANLLLFRDYFKRYGARVILATQDGSEGFGGLVTQLLERQLDEASTPPCAIMTCGPGPMIKAVAGMTMSRGVPCFASLENRMACGFGACLGCVTRTADGRRYVTVCRKGPVFDVAEVEITDG